MFSKKMTGLFKKKGFRQKRQSNIQKREKTPKSDNWSHKNEMNQFEKRTPFVSKMEKVFFKTKGFNEKEQVSMKREKNCWKVINCRFKNEMSRFRIVVCRFNFGKEKRKVKNKLNVLNVLHVHNFWPYNISNILKCFLEYFWLYWTSLTFFFFLLNQGHTHKVTHNENQ